MARLMTSTVLWRSDCWAKMKSSIFFMPDEVPSMKACRFLSTLPISSSENRLLKLSMAWAAFSLSLPVRPLRSPVMRRRFSVTAPKSWAAFWMPSIAADRFCCLASSTPEMTAALFSVFSRKRLIRFWLASPRRSLIRRTASSMFPTISSAFSLKPRAVWISPPGGRRAEAFDPPASSMNLEPVMPT